VLLCTQFWRNDLFGLFCGVASGYAVLDVILLCAVLATDYERYSAEAIARSNIGTAAVSTSTTSIALPLQPVTNMRDRGLNNIERDVTHTIAVNMVEPEFDQKLQKSSFSIFSEHEMEVIDFN